MTTIGTSLSGGVISAPKSKPKSLPQNNIRFDFFYATLTLLFVFGLFLDGWAHNHGMVDNTFFTPWHGVLYGSVGLIALTLFGTHIRNMGKGYTTFPYVPRGYALSMIGVVLFFIGGGFDFLWHSLFGFEANIETLISPAHTLLATAAFLFVTGPLRAVWRRKDAKGWGELFPALASLTVVMSLLTFFTQFATFFGNPQVITPAGQMGNLQFFGDMSGIVSVMIPSALIMGVILVAIRRWELPFGALTVMLTANSALMYWMRYADRPYMLPIVGTAFATGLLADVLLRVLHPSTARPLALRAFAFIVPFVLSLSYYLAIVATVGTTWKVHLVLGGAIFAAVGCLFLSYVLVPPAFEIDSAEAA
jgi:hypothetical protein